MSPESVKVIGMKLLALVLLLTPFYAHPNANSIVVVAPVSELCTTSATATSTTVATSAVQIIGSNPTRKGMKLYNNSANSVYVSAGVPPCNSSSTLFAIIPTFANYDFSTTLYIGSLCAIRNAGTGNVVVTEFY